MSAPLFRPRDGRPLAPTVRTLTIETTTLRLPDRAGGEFGEGNRARLKPIGRPSDIYGDVVVTLAARVTLG